MSDTQQDQEAIQSFDLSKLEPSHHELVQRGRWLACDTPGHSHGSKIPPGKMLSKDEKGAYVLVDE